MAQLRHYQMYEPQMFSGGVNDVFFSNFCEMKPQKISKVIQPLLAPNRHIAADVTPMVVNILLNAVMSGAITSEHMRRPKNIPQWDGKGRIL